jgi:two-component system chemotaxis sensor kinase CheA
MEEDAELLQDFLVEAGEILEQLGEQLVELENRPQDNDLLNAVFRGFHTIKGGASFLNLEALVALCHRAEDVFNALRNGERQVNTEVMDVILPVLDVLNGQFDTLRSGQEPEHADPELLRKLEAILTGERASEAPAQVKETNGTAESVANKSSAPQSSEQSTPEITSEELENPMDSVTASEPTQESAAGAEDEITEEEFEALLDELDAHRKSQPESAQVDAKPAEKAEVPASKPEADMAAQKTTQTPAQEQSGTATQATASGQGDDEFITEEEFDALLDELHGNKTTAQATAGAGSAGAQAQTKAPANARGGKTDAPAVKSETASRAAPKPKESTQTETTVRVDTKRLDDIMNMVGELVLVRNRLATIESAKNDEEMSKVVANLDVVTADLQTAVMKTRMQPIKKVFGRFPRVVRDLARNLNKEVNLELQGEDTDLDKNLVEALADPLVHLVRNAVDHGIETPEERVAKGKPRPGTVILTAEQEGDHILLTIQDDGKGMDAEQLRKAAVNKGILDEESAARLEAKDCYNLIFAPGFSTKQEISDVSGRGVGMDVVKTRIVQLNGSVEIDSKKDRGSIIIIKVPLTLAIMPTLMVMLERQIFALPLASVNEIFHLDLTHTNVVDGQLVVMVRDKALPLFYLRHWLIKNGAGQSLPREGHVVVVSMGVQRIGFVVDTLIGQEEVVIKPLGALLHGMKGLAGATITGDGRISLILDIPGLMQRYARRI